MVTAGKITNINLVVTGIDDNSRGCVSLLHLTAKKFERLERNIMRKLLAIMLLTAMLSACVAQPEAGKTMPPAKTGAAEGSTAAVETSETTEASKLGKANEKIAKSTEVSFIKSEYQCTSDRRNAYAKYLYENFGSTNELLYGIYIGDVNKDENDEMIVATTPFGMWEIVYYGEEGLKTVQLEVMSMWGNSWYNAQTGEFINRTFYGHTTGTFGADDYHIYSWDGKNYIETYVLMRQGGYAEYEGDEISVKEYGKAYINGEEVTNEEFEEARDKLVSLVNSLDNNSLEYIYNSNFSTSEYIPEGADTNIESYLEQKLYF